MRAREHPPAGDGDLPLGARPVRFLVALAAVGLATTMLTSTLTGLLQVGILQGGPDLVEVPDLIGTQETNATQQLSQRGLEAEVAIARNTEVAAGEVISQRPFAGERAVAGSSVEVAVSAGDGFARVPDLRGSPTDDLFPLLAAHHLAVGEITEEANDLVGPGEVIRQEPTPGELLLRGQPVDVVMSMGPPTLEVPNR